MFHNILRSIDPDYDESKRASSQLPKMPLLATFIDEHVISTPYRFSIQKCDKQSCKHCKSFRAPEGTVRDLVLQRQPTPIHDKKRPGHFLSRKESLLSFHENSSTKLLTDLSCLPSKTACKNSGNEKDSKKKKKKEDTAAGNTLSKWAATNVRRTVTCEDCRRPRCLFSKKLLDNNEKDELQSYIENNQFICGNPLFSEDSKKSPLETKVVHRINMSCDDGVEKEYYNPDQNKRQHFISIDICAHCTETKSLLYTKELEEEKQTDGFKCLPICRDCLNTGLLPFKHGRKNNPGAAKERKSRRKAAQEKRKPKPKK